MYANYCIDVASQQMQTKKYLQLLYHNDTTVWYHGMEVFVVVEWVVVGRRRVNEKTFPITTIREPLGSHLVKNRNITTHLLHEIT